MSKETKIREAKNMKRSGLVSLVIGAAMIAPKIIELSTGYNFQPDLSPNYASWSTISTYFSVLPLLIGLFAYKGGRRDLKEIKK